MPERRDKVTERAFAAVRTRFKDIVILCVGSESHGETGNERVEIFFGVKRDVRRGLRRIPHTKAVGVFARQGVFARKKARGKLVAVTKAVKIIAARIVKAAGMGEKGKISRKKRVNVS